MVTKMTFFYRTDKAKNNASSGSTDARSGQNNSATGHSHANKPTLDDLGTDANERLTLKGDLLDTPLRKEDW